MKQTTPNSPWRPTLLLLILMAIIGGWLYYQGTDIHWPGFLSMVVFYGLIFYFGAYAAGMKSTEDTEGVMLAGRSIPLFVAVFTMVFTHRAGFVQDKLDVS